MEHVNNFHKLLTAENDARLLPELSGAVRQDAKFTRLEYRADGNVAMLSRELGDRVPTKYVAKPLYRMGRDDSRHKVHFGLLRFGDADSGGTIERDVAVKDCLISYGLGEIALNQYAASRGLYTFKPLGLLIGREKHQGNYLAHLITEFDPEVKPLDSLIAAGMGQEDLKQILTDLGVSTANFHINALFHGDLEFKNVVQRTTGELCIVDLEHTVGAEEVIAIASLREVFSRRHVDEAQRTVDRLVGADIRSVKTSLDGIPICKGYSDTMKLKLLRKTVIDAYADAINDNNNPYKSVLSKSAASIYNKYLSSD